MSLKMREIRQMSQEDMRMTVAKLKLELPVHTAVHAGKFGTRTASQANQQTGKGTPHLGRSISLSLARMLTVAREKGWNVEQS